MSIVKCPSLRIQSFFPLGYYWCIDHTTNGMLNNIIVEVLAWLVFTSETGQLSFTFTSQRLGPLKHLWVYFSLVWSGSDDGQVLRDCYLCQACWAINLRSEKHRFNSAQPWNRDANAFVKHLTAEKTIKRSMNPKTDPEINAVRNTKM